MPNAHLLKPLVYIMCTCMWVACTGIKSSQKQAVEKYAIVTKGISTMPPEIYSRVYQLRSQTQTLQLSAVIATNQSARESIEALQLDLSEKMKFLDLVDSFAYAYRIVGKYADMVRCLVSDSYLKEFAKNKKEWQLSFDGLVTLYNDASVRRMPPSTLIPASVGSIAADIVRELGSAKIKRLQRKYLNAAIVTARIPFEGICDDFLNTDIPKIKKELDELPRFINENYKDFLNNVSAYETKQGNNPYNYYKLYVPIYLNWQVQLKELGVLVRQLQVCITGLRNSYGVLQSYLASADKNVGQIPEPIMQLEKDYASLMGTITKFTEARERLYKISY
jgi:hypothetical protein